MFSRCSFAQRHLFPKVFSHDVQPGSTASQDPSENAHWGLTAAAGPMLKDFGILPRRLSIIQQAQRLRGRKSIQRRRYPQGLGEWILLTTEGDITDDLQGSWEIDHQLWYTFWLRDTNYRNTNIHRTRLWRLPLAVTRCLVSTTYMQKLKCWR